MPSLYWKVGLTLHAAFVIIIAVSAYLGVLPATYRVLPHADIIGHAVLIGLLAFFLDGTLRFRPLVSGRVPALRAAPVIILVIAGVEELAQSLSPRRTASLLDFAADVVGVCLASWGANLLEQAYQSNRQDRISK